MCPREGHDRHGSYGLNLEIVKTEKILVYKFKLKKNNPVRLN